jgi:hypothetical protein
MERLYQLIGREHDIDDVGRSLYAFACASGAPAFGALHLTCSDESEKECIDAFQHNFATHLLPNLKLGERSIFRIANLGARYEWGAAHIAEEHYSTSEARKRFKLMLVKINSHVCVDRTDQGHSFGRMRRYDSESAYCGALHALMGGSRMPFADDIEEALASDGSNRLRRLLDDSRVSADDRSLFVALASARTQARRAMIDIQDRRPESPTLYVVLPCVTLNKRAKDGEIVCGVYVADWRAKQPVHQYRGLGGDPAAYSVERTEGGLRVSDDQIDILRPARNHRELVKETWERNGAPESSRAAVLLFAEGIAGIHHLHRAQRLAGGGASREDAGILIEDVRRGLGQLPEDFKARAMEIMESLPGSG